MDSYPAEKIIETGRNPGRKGSFYYDELFTDGKGIVCAGSNLPGWCIQQADGRKLLQRINQRKYESGADK